MQRDIFMEHNGVIIYHVCKPSTTRPQAFWYTFYPDSGNLEAFDIRQIGIYPEVEDTTMPITQGALSWFEQVKEGLRDRLDRGILIPPHNL